jgi:c-di-GMP-binding flagellar brake protein YcgR
MEVLPLIREGIAGQTIPVRGPKSSHLGSGDKISSTSKKPGLSSHLLRSGAQIGRLLEALVARRETVTAELRSGGEPFTSHLIHADPAGQFILIAMAASKSANAALLAVPRVTLVSATGSWHVQFVAVEPRAVMHGGTPAIRLRYPGFLAVQQRRQHPRVDVPPTVSLHCVADAGGITPFDARIVDISLGGIGVLLHPSDITLEPGTVLVGCRIKVPGRDPVTIDLEVHYSEVLTLPDASRARRSGFRFVNASDELKKLVDELGKP